MRKAFLLLLVLLQVFLFTSCKNLIQGRNEIEDITFINVIGIEETEDEQVKLTVTSKSAPSDQAEPTAGEYVTVYGETIFDAIRNLDKYSTKRPFWGHAEYIIFSENTAKKDIVKYLDFFTRQYQFRLNTNVLIIKDATAEEVVKETSLKGHFISDRLSHLTKNINSVSVSHDIKLHDLLEMFDRPFSSAYIPSINLTKLFYTEEGDSKKDIELNGFTIFKDDKMIGTVEDDLAKGLNWVRNQFMSGIIIVKDQKDGKVALEVTQGETEVIPQIDDAGNLSITIKILVVSSIGEMYSNKDIFNEKSFSLLEKQQKDIVHDQVAGIIDYAQKNKADFLDIWNKVFHKYPKESLTSNEEWSEVFAKVPFHIEVDSKIVRTYLKRQPLGSQEVTR